MGYSVLTEFALSDGDLSRERYVQAIRSRICMGREMDRSISELIGALRESQQIHVHNCPNGPSCGVISPLLTRENYRDRPRRSDVASLTESSKHKVNVRVHIRLPFVDEHLRDLWPREFMEYSSRERIQRRA